MHVVATAGHVDHGKSTLVRLLTGTEPDRWAEERRRGLTIGLGFAWTTLPGGEQLALVDVPGHERFVSTMLAGVGPVPAVVFVVAADHGWAAQSQEHLAALDALGVRRGLLVVTKSDLVDPEPARREAQERLDATSLAGVGSLTVSSRDPGSIDRLRAALARLVAGMTAPDPTADVRLWVDRSFVVRGAGVVATGTLGAGRIRGSDQLEVARTGQRVTVRGLESLGERASVVQGVARVAVNLRGVDRDAVRPGDALLAPGRWLRTGEVDVRALSRGELPERLMLHVGAEAVAVRVRAWGAGVVRLSLARALPLRVGDRALLRDPGRQRVMAGVVVLDVRPPPVRGRAAAAARVESLRSSDGTPDAEAEVRRRKVVDGDDLARMGVPPPATALVGRWFVDRDEQTRLTSELAAATAAYQVERPLEPGPTVEELRRRVGLPATELVPVLLPRHLEVRTGAVVPRGGDRPLPPAVERALATLRDEMGDAVACVDAGRLHALGLGSHEVAAAARAGRVVRLGGGLVVLAAAVARARTSLSELPDAFGPGAARDAWGTSRRLAIALLEHLDEVCVTRRNADGSRSLLS